MKSREQNLGKVWIVVDGSKVCLWGFWPCLPHEPPIAKTLPPTQEGTRQYLPACQWCLSKGFRSGSSSAEKEFTFCLNLSRGEVWFKGRMDK